MVASFEVLVNPKFSEYSKHSIPKDGLQQVLGTGRPEQWEIRTVRQDELPTQESNFIISGSKKVVNIL